MTRRPNLFIVGAPKCGTTSLYAYLDAHPDVFMSPFKEPNYFSPDVQGTFRRNRFGYPDGDRYLALLEWFPDARVVHVMRDPRAVYVSDLRRRRSKRTKPYSWLDKIPLLLPALLVLQTTIVWRGAARRHVRLQQRHPDRYMHVRFEDVVRQPGEVLPRLFDFLGVELPPDPTDVKVYARGYNAGEVGLDAGAADRWQATIGPLARRWLTFSLGSHMRRFGYLGA